MVFDFRAPGPKIRNSNITTNVAGNVTGNLISVIRRIKPYNGEKPEDSSDSRRRQAS